MHEILILAIKGLAGGGLVVAFALPSEGLAPKRCAGLFSAAPAVALASMTLVLVDKGAYEAHQNATGMIAGDAGTVAYAAAAVPLLRTGELQSRPRLHYRRGSRLPRWRRVAAAGMSTTSTEPTIRDSPGRAPYARSGKITEARPHDLAIRFAAGAVTSIIAGAVTLVFGARIGGILLAFPAILVASLTLIEEQEDSINAREDARGAIIGRCAPMSFAAVAALSLVTCPERWRC